MTTATFLRRLFRSTFLLSVRALRRLAVLLLRLNREDFLLFDARCVMWTYAEVLTNGVSPSLDGSAGARANWSACFVTALTFLISLDASGRGALSVTFLSSMLQRPRAPASRASASASTPDSASSAASVGVGVAAVDDDGDDFDDDDDEDVSDDDEIVTVGDDVSVVDEGGVSSASCRKS